MFSVDSIMPAVPSGDMRVRGGLHGLLNGVVVALGLGVGGLVTIGACCSVGDGSGSGVSVVMGVTISGVGAAFWRKAKVETSNIATMAKAIRYFLVLGYGGFVFRKFFLVCSSA